MARFVQPSAYRQIGLIQKVKGLEGLMVVRLGHAGIQWNPACIFLHRYHTYVPYMVERWEEREYTAFLALKGIRDRTEAKVLHQRSLFLPADVVATSLQGTPYRLIGYQVIDKQHGDLGEVLEVELGLQLRCCVNYQDEHLWIPLQASEGGIDDVNRQITTQLPSDYLTTLLSV